MSSSLPSIATISTTAAPGISRETIREIRAQSPGTTIEVLTPDFLRKDGALERVVEAKPDVFNHNLETVPSLYLTVRPGARYYHSVRLLARVKELDPSIFTKSGIMVGLGEERNEILQVMDDLRSAEVDFLTVGQYLQPTKKHHAVVRYIEPAEFEALKTIAFSKGFLMVSSSPLTRSSHHAGEDFEKLRAARAEAARPILERFSRCPHSARRGGCDTRRTRCSISSPTSSAIPNSCRCASGSR